MTQQFDNWARALAGDVVNWDINEPASGYWRKRVLLGYDKNDKPIYRFEPVAIWREDGELFCEVNGQMEPDIDRIGWPYIARNPIPYSWYLEFTEGKPWPDHHEAVTRSNQAPPDGSVESLRDAIDDLAREALKLIDEGAAQNQAAADRAADLKNRLGQLEKEADIQRRAEKSPLETAAKAVDAKWVPIRDKAATAKTKLANAVITPFLVEQKKADEARKAAAKAAGESVDERQRTTAGSRGRSVGLRPYKRAEITDYTVCATHFLNHEKVRELIQDLANAAVRNGLEIPGTKLIMEERAA